MIFNRGHAYV
jgi:hypothetical protein